MSADLANWVPNSLMAAALLVAIGMLWRMFARRLDKFEATLEALKDRMPHVATLEQLGRLGDRFDERHAKLSDRVSVLENAARDTRSRRR